MDPKLSDMAYQAIGGAFGTYHHISRETLVEFGRQMWELTYRGTDDDFEAFEALGSRVDEAAEPWRTALKATMQIPTEQLSIFGAARWYDQGLPEISIGHKLAASLAATGLPQTSLEFVIPPWRAFTVRLPTDLFQTQDEKLSRMVSIERLLVHHVKRSDGLLVWNFTGICQAPSGQLIWSHGRTTDMMANSDSWADWGNMWEQTSFAIKDPQDNRLMACLCRVILGLCLELSNPKAYKPVGKQAYNYPAKAPIRQHKEPLVRTFAVRREVKIDVREAVGEYIKRGGSSPKVQTLVRGHWKWQAHGSKMSLRKWIHIEGYWRGPEDAPILPRTVKLEESKEGGTCPPTPKT
jgi:hypothetical protein